ncbi:hypothetical protein, partial [Ligilactobacillus ruminis]|uniref:hypothetical protein n=1 Tax=Ligilactobacillus ruminis TaxID=1623 RepID=UPI001C02F0D3
MEISKITWRAALSGAAFGKSSAVYGHIDENGASVRNWPARKMAITDKMGENSRLSVKIQSSPNLCVKYFSQAQVVQGMRMHPCL